jgi:Zn-dependent peptidase ImmA (M78 family)/transcriptional regulator with XRE-family HTH domain
MRPSTPGFVGARLREARDVRGISAVALSEIAIVSPQAISQYENGRSSPSPDVLGRIATAVNLPVAFFTRPLRDRTNGTIFYRSMSSATKASRARAERRFVWLRDIEDYLSDYVAFPDLNIPDLDLPSDPLLLSDAEIDDAANRVRVHWGMRNGPIANMIALLENQGAIVARDRLNAEALDGLSEVATDDRPFVLIGIDKGTPVRWRFDAAHELGHVLLHRHLQSETLLRPEQYKRVEQQAHRFAASFLLPTAEFGDDFFAVNLDALVALKPKWKVSVAMMIMTAQRAGFINEESARRLWINYSRHGWRRNEPYDDSMEIEEPRLLRRAVELTVGSGTQSADDITNALALPAPDVETLCNLPSGYLGNFAPVSLRSPSSDERGHNVIPFRRA